jgi:putative transcriptional regulator
VSLLQAFIDPATSSVTPSATASKECDSFKLSSNRDERGWTQQQLAEATGVSRQSINSIERERYVPSLELALTFARVFRLPTDEIFSLEKKK